MMGTTYVNRLPRGAQVKQRLGTTGLGVCLDAERGGNRRLETHNEEPQNFYYSPNSILW